MSRKTYKPEQITGMLRETEVKLSQGQAVGEICRGVGMSEQGYHRWRREFGGMEVSQIHRLKELESVAGQAIDPVNRLPGGTNARLRKAVSDLTLDKLIVNEPPTGKRWVLYSLSNVSANGTV